METAAVDKAIEEKIGSLGAFGFSTKLTPGKILAGSTGRLCPPEDVTVMPFKVAVVGLCVVDLKAPRSCRGSCCCAQWASAMCLHIWVVSNIRAPGRVG